jgi:sialate O-acetylesterase
MLIFTRRNEKIPLKAYDQSWQMISLNNSNLFNAMIYPFTRIVVYGAIWYQGESNADHNRDKYSCSFSKMIEYWRQTWNQRTNGLTDIQFPFGFVQVNLF